MGRGEGGRSGKRMTQEYNHTVNQMHKFITHK